MKILTGLEVGVRYIGKAILALAIGCGSTSNSLDTTASTDSTTNPKDTEQIQTLSKSSLFRAVATLRRVEMTIEVVGEFGTEKDEDLVRQAFRSDSVGTGFVFDERGYILTCRHVIDPGRQIVSTLDKMARTEIVVEQTKVTDDAGRAERETLTFQKIASLTITYAVRDAKGKRYAGLYDVRANPKDIVTIGDKQVLRALMAFRGAAEPKTPAAQIVEIDDIADLAVLKIEESDPLPILRFRVEKPIRGASVVGFGFLSYDTSKQWPDIRAEPGLFKETAQLRELGYNSKIEAPVHVIKMRIKVGYSGGPVLDMDGNVTGVIQGFVRGVPRIFAVPVSDIRRFVTKKAPSDP